MIVTLHSTTKIVTLITPSGEVPARIWEGYTDSGIAVHAFITRIAHAITEPAAVAAAFIAELQEQQPPSAEIEPYPLRMIL